MSFFTVGHSNRAIADFLALLQDAQITLIVDVRKLHGSTKHPQFNEDELAESLANAGIGYRQAEELGGRRLVSKTIPFETNGWWENRSFHNYADHALSDEFAAGLARVRDEASEQNVAVMCSEAVWWRCHRRIIADHALTHGDEVTHLMDEGKQMPAKLSDGAVVGDDGKVRYPSET